MLEILFSFSMLIFLVSIINIKLAQIIAIIMCIFILINLYFGD
jgi:hypothetical protein